MDRDIVFRARQAGPDDVGAIARIEVETWRATYPGMLPDRQSAPARADPFPAG